MAFLVTGSAGFIGTHTTAALLGRGSAVVGIDNLSRRGSRENCEWLAARTGSFTFERADISRYDEVARIFERHGGFEAVIHLAGQVAVTTSVTNPRLDFEGNALGTFNMLEATRAYSPTSPFLFSSTNKVYGGMEHIAVAERNGRYGYASLPHGADEETPLDFHSPYGCSKGSADQYVRDYARIYGMRTVVFRQSCIYGSRQFGIEDQGWVAWLTIATLLGKPITIYGDGKQVRDVLWVEDLIDLYLRAIDQIDVASGKVFNAGGGPENTLSLNELVDMLRGLAPQRTSIAQADWRPGDQRVFVANVARARETLGWTPKVSPREGVMRLIEWTAANEALLRDVLP